jgi:hypothetical protein
MVRSENPTADTGQHNEIFRYKGLKFNFVDPFNFARSWLRSIAYCRGQNQAKY